MFIGSMSKSGASTQLYNKVDAGHATHLKAKNTNEFFEINKDLVVKAIRKVDGETIEEPVSFAEINNEETFFCYANGEKVLLDGNLYAHLAFMAKSTDGKGTHLKCEPIDAKDEGLYVRKEEIQVPAYKKLPMDKYHNITQTRSDGKYYTYEETLEVDGKIIKLPNDNVKKSNGKWYYEEDGEGHEGNYTKKRIYIDHLLLDEEKIVDITSLKMHGDDYVLENIDGEDIVVGKKDVELQGAFIEGSTIVATEQMILPKNQLKQQPRIEEGLNLAFVWPKQHPAPNGLVRVDINRGRTWAKFTYADGHQEIFAEYTAQLHVKDGVKENRVQKISVEDLGEEGIKLEFYQKQKSEATNVVVDEQTQQVTSFTMNGTEISNIEWREVDGYKEIESYTIGDTRITDIQWRAGEVMGCKVHTIDDNGNEQVNNIGDLKYSKYKQLAINCELTEKLENVKEENGLLSFKLGDYKFSEAEVNEDGSVGRCVVKYDGKQEEIDLSTDERFKQLRVAVNISLDESRLSLLQYSKLVEKKDGKYELVADVTQTGAMANGFAPAEKLETVEQAVDAQERYTSLADNKKYPTWVLDEHGQAHKLSDFETTYTGLANFDHNLDPLAKALGKVEYEINKGKIEPDFSNAEANVSDIGFLGGVCCGDSLTLALAFVLLPTAAAALLVVKGVKQLAKIRIKNTKVKSVIHKTQKEVKQNCPKNINKLVRETHRQIRKYKRKYSSAELDSKLSELKEKTKLRYIKEVGRLQVLGKGSFNSFFDMAGKNKLKPDNFLAYLTGLKIQKELKYGKPNSVEYKREMYKLRKQKLSKSERLIKKVQIMEEFGGRDAQYQAHKIKKRHLGVFVKYENELRAQNGKDATNKKDYKKDIKLARDKKLASVGNIEDKIKVFKDELEVRGKARRKAIAGKRESLEKEIKNVKVSTVNYDELVDRKGNSLLDSCTKDAMSYWDLEVSKMFEGNNNRPKHRFGFGYRKTLNADQRATQPTELTDHMNKMASTTDQRRLEHDKSLVEDHVRQANIYINELRSQNLAKIDRTLNYGDKNYESIFIRETRLKGLKEKNQSACDEIERYIDAIPNKELSPSQIKQLKRSIDENRAEVLAEVKKATEEKKEVKTAYEMKVEEWAKEELKEKNPTEYELIESGAKDPKDSQELEMLKVKHHVAESISAEVLCEQDEFGFSQFLAENTHLDPTSKEAQYAYYAEYKKDHNTTDMETLEQGELFSDRFDEIATDRVNNDELNIHEEVEDKHIVAPEEKIEVDEVVNEVSSEEPKAKEVEKDEQEAVEEVVEKREETIVEPKSTVVPAENVNIETTSYDAVEPVEETETEDLYVPLDEVGDEQIEENVDENADENVEDVYMTQEEEDELKRNAGKKPKRDKSNIVIRSKESKQSSKDNEETQGLTK